MPNDKALIIEAERWLGLNEALERIRCVQNCAPIQAQRHLKAKIGAGVIPVKWQDSEGANDLPNPQYLKGTKLQVNLGGGTFIVSDSKKSGLAHDELDDTYRPLLVLREAVFMEWPDGNLTGKRKLQTALENQKTTPERTKRENDCFQWITLVEAEEHIEALQLCDSVEALRQLKEEIGGGIVAVKWADDPKHRPDATILKNSTFLTIGPGIVQDGNRLRPLLVNRDNVLHLWPAPNDEASRVEIKCTPKKPQSSATEGAIRTAARDVYNNKGLSKPPNQEQAWDSIKKALPNASRKRVRKILRETEFEKQRLKAGNQSRRQT